VFLLNPFYRLAEDAAELARWMALAVALSGHLLYGPLDLRHPGRRLRMMAVPFGPAPDIAAWEL